MGWHGAAYKQRETEMKTWVSLIVCVGLVVAMGCTQDSTTTTGSSTSNAGSAVDGSNFLITNEPDDAMGVITVREEAKDQTDVVIVGRIGGSKNPWVEGLAAFSIVDPSLKSCAETGSDNCPKPWDYC